MPDTAVIALGSNLGDPRSNITRALELLAATFTIRKVSSLYRTEPVGGPAGQPLFLNGVAIASISCAPRETMNLLLELERQMGRERRERWGPRIIDLDLLDQRGAVIDEPGLALPHPRMSKRAFVLLPLNEIAPSWVHPVSGKTPSDMIELLSDAELEVVIGKEPPL